ncbi:MAG: cation diffusion facilitator family transporter [Prochlorococcaceae cyanobacterium]
MTTAPRLRSGGCPMRLVAQTLLLVLKFSVAMRLGSLAFAADALGTGATLLSGLAAVLLSRWSDPRPDRDHPYGHTKVQALVSLAITVLLSWTLLELAQACALRLAAAQGLLQGAAFPLLWLLPLALGQLLLRGWRHAMGWTTAMAASAVVLALAQGWSWLDAAAALLIAAVVLRERLRSLLQQLPWLLDQIALAPEAIHRAAMEVPGVLNCHDIASRGVRGQQVFIDMHMVVDATDLPTAHRITELVEERLESQFGPVRCTIHLEPREYASAAITFKGAHG